MSKRYNEYKQMDLAQVNEEIRSFWEKNKTFEKSLEIRKGAPDFVFYEGPPSANGVPGIHHVMARTIKDLFCRFKTMEGFLVNRKAGWDTHGLPVELGVEKALGIRKDDIGKTISIEEYNTLCKKDVMKYTDQWEELTEIMGYWVDMSDPYITYDNKYIETLWWLLKQLFDKGLLYKGYTIQPYSPAAGTGLSTHELNQPGCYKDVKDSSAVAMFKVSKESISNLPFKDLIKWDVYFLAWTTTPWTLPSNTALAVGKNIYYVAVETFSPYPKKGNVNQKVVVILAKELLQKYFPEKNADLKFEDYKAGNKQIPYKVIGEFKGEMLEGISYEQLLPFSQPKEGAAFKVVCGDFVTTEDGTGIVHIAPSFGADDFRVAKQNGIGSLTLVDKQGKFLPEVKDDIFLYGGEFVKQEYLTDEEKQNEFEKQKKILESNGKIANLREYLSVDERIILKMQEEGKLFKKEKYEHSYPHCWRTDKPVLYYPLDSWFIKTTALKERMIELNKTIHWQPSSTGTGRFGQWLENLVDWNLSRSRFWGTPLPIWVTDDFSEITCIGSVEELKKELEKSVAAGFIKNNPLKNFVPGNNSCENYSLLDLHKPYVDNITLVSKSGKPMHREPDLIDVWFDSGAMPYAQWHYPFEHKDDFDKLYPADFIAEGVDQTRGWFFTLHALAVMLFDSVAYKNIVSNGLVLDKNGNKMSKRLGNGVDPFEVIHKYGADILRWYMMTNSQPWDNLKFDMEGLEEIKRKFFGTLYNTYSFFSLYANIDEFTGQEKQIPYNKRPEIDQWIISLLNSLIESVHKYYAEYEPTQAGRLVQDFVSDHLSNWYVRLNRKRYWGGKMDDDKLAAYQTLYECLLQVTKLMAPIAPFYAEKLFNDLHGNEQEQVESVHHAKFPGFNQKVVDKKLEERMQLAQDVTSLVLSLRRKVNIKVRQPLSKILIPVLNTQFVEQIQLVKEIILAEVNVKEIEFVDANSGIIVKKVKPNFKLLGPKMGKYIKELSARLNNLTQQQIQQIEKEGHFIFNAGEEKIEVLITELEILTQDMPGWQLASNGPLTVALDITITDDLRNEGVARELVNRIQNIRKESGFEVTDKIYIHLLKNETVEKVINKHKAYISSQTLALDVKLFEKLEQNNTQTVEIDNNLKIQIQILKV